MRLLGTRILVKKNEASATQTKSGILLLANEKEVEKVGEVVLTGPGLPDEKMEIKEGDTVRYTGNGLNITHDGEDHIIINQSEVLAVL